jgi:shikimate kinase
MSAASGHVLLIGFMGAGKSSVAARLGELLGLEVVEMDERIEAAAGMEIAAIFEREGEQGFRRRESELLGGGLGQGRCVISCGGGVVTAPGNIALLRGLGTVVYLEVTAEEALRRIADARTRPLLNSKTSPAQLLEQRRALYESAADIRVDSCGKSIGEVAAEVASALAGMAHACGAPTAGAAS